MADGKSGGKRNSGAKETFRQAIPSIGLSLERGTENVPSDDRFHVILDGEELLSSHSQMKALAEYRRIRDAIGGTQSNNVDVREALRKKLAESEADRFLAQSSREKRARALFKGGRGGRGGVGG